MAFSEEVKRLAKQRAHYTCVVCRQVRGFLEVHHIIPEAEGGPDVIDNAAPLCPTCHGNFGDNPKLRKQLTELRDWWWAYCERQEQHPDVQAVYTAVQPYLERIDYSHQQVTKGLGDLDELKSALIDFKQFQVQQLSSASSLSAIVSFSSAST